MNKRFYKLFWILILLTILSLSLVLGKRNSDIKKQEKMDSEIIIPEAVPPVKEVIEKLTLTNKIVVKNICDNTLITTILDKKIIKELVEIIKKGNEVVGDITFEGSCRDLEMYDQDEKLICIIKSYIARVSLTFSEENSEYNNSYYIDMPTLNGIINPQ